jgi:hypothetical protein
VYLGCCAPYHAHEAIDPTIKRTIRSTFIARRQLQQCENPTEGGWQLALGCFVIIIARPRQYTGFGHALRHYETHWMTDTIKSVAAACLGAVLMDEPWIDFGFTKRPRYGSFFQTLRPTWKRDLEKTVAQQILATFTAAYVIAGYISSKEIPQVIAAFAMADLTALGYRSNDEGVTHLTKMIAQYHNTPVGYWYGVIAKQIDPMSIPDKKLSAAVTVGCIQYAENIDNMILVLRQKLI